MIRRLHMDRDTKVEVDDLTDQAVPFVVVRIGDGDNDGAIELLVTSRAELARVEGALDVAHDYLAAVMERTTPEPSR